MCQPNRWPTGRQPAIAPRQHRQRHRIQIQTLVGELVFMARRSELVRVFVNDAIVHEALQSLAEDVGGDTEISLELLETDRAVEQFTDQQYPPGRRRPGG